MADAREMFVWENHALEQWSENKTGHEFNDDSIFRIWLKEINAKSVLDFGCGGGLWRKLFKDQIYTGADQSPNMITHAAKRFPKDNWVVFDWKKQPFADDSFDVVFTSAVLQHNKHCDKAIVLPIVYNMIKPGGHFMCTENTFRTDNFHYSFPKIKEWNEKLDDGYSFTSVGWEKFMANYGFKMITFSPPSNYLYLKV